MISRKRGHRSETPAAPESLRVFLRLRARQYRDLLSGDVSESINQNGENQAGTFVLPPSGSGARVCTGSILQSLEFVTIVKRQATTGAVNAPTDAAILFVPDIFKIE